MLRTSFLAAFGLVSRISFARRLFEAGSNSGEGERAESQTEISGRKIQSQSTSRCVSLSTSAIMGTTVTPPMQRLVRLMGSVVTTGVEGKLSACGTPAGCA
jgi:hypothetical protein